MTPGTVAIAAPQWALRIARTMMLAMYAMVPIHYFVPCEASAVVGSIACVFLLVTGILSIVAHRLGPGGLALAAMVLHSLSMH